MSEIPDRQQRLLIVDDSKVIRVTARKILQNHFETVEAVDGNDAWRMLESEPSFALVVSDLTMPGMDGFELLQKIRHSQQPHIRDLPVIIITGANDSEATMQRATQAGATDFIGKPFDAVHLLARTQSHANAYLNRQSLTEQNISLEDRSRQDATTGLANETALMEHGFQQLSHAIRHRTGFAVAQIEIDGYDTIFHQYGQGMAESVVKYAADVLQSSIRGEDMVARTGPARFALLLSGMNPGGIRHLTARISDDIRGRSVKTGHDSIRFTVSIGVAAPEITPDARFDQLLKMARNNLQVALHNGGNTVEPGDSPASRPPPPPATPARPARSAQDFVDALSGSGRDCPGEVIELSIEESYAALQAGLLPDATILEEPEMEVAVATPDPAHRPEVRVDPEPPATPEPQLEDEIIITAPFSLFDDPEPEPEAPADNAAAAAAARTDPVGETATAAREPAETAAAPAETNTAHRTKKLLAHPEPEPSVEEDAGPKRGMLGRLFGIFSRHNRHKD